MELKKEAERLWNKLKELDDIFNRYLRFPDDTDDYLIDLWIDRFGKLKIKLILASFKSVSREAAEQCYKKHRISKVNYDKIAKKYFYTWFNKYWKSITNK